MNLAGSEISLLARSQGPRNEVLISKVMNMFLKESALDRVFNSWHCKVPKVQLLVVLGSFHHWSIQMTIFTPFLLCGYRRRIGKAERAYSKASVGLVTAFSPLMSDSARRILITGCERGQGKAKSGGKDAGWLCRVVIFRQLDSSVVLDDGLKISFSFQEAINPAHNC